MKISGIFLLSISTAFLSQASDGSKILGQTIKCFFLKDYIDYDIGRLERSGEVHNWAGNLIALHKGCALDLYALYPRKKQQTKTL